MRFERFTWDLYKDSERGKSAIEKFATAKDKMREAELECKYNPHLAPYQDRKKMEDFYDLLWNDIFTNFAEGEADSLEHAKELYEDIIDGVTHEGKYRNTLNWVTQISFLLFEYEPEYYYPHLFNVRIQDLYRIADVFDIQLPPLPNRTAHRDRCMYYWRLCEKLYQFRKDAGLTPNELCAFLYDFAPNYIKHDSDLELPQPQQAWFVGGRFSDRDTANEDKYWQSNIETRRGDLMFHYETAPISAITCYWRAYSDGIADPFEYYWSFAQLSDKADIPHITLHELQDDEYFSKHSLVRKKFQGVSGWPLTNEDMQNLLRMIAAKGGNTDSIPKLQTAFIPNNFDIKIEKDVEENLLIPLLNSMGIDDLDYKRQIPLKIGRGERVYPDFALHCDKNANGYTAKVLIEAKLYMANNKEREQAYLQGLSYAHLMEANVLVLCDKLYVYAYDGCHGFDRNTYIRYSWNELGSNPDKFNKLKKLLL